MLYKTKNRYGNNIVSNFDKKDTQTCDKNAAS